MANLDLAVSQPTCSPAELVVLKRLTAKAASNGRLREMFLEEGRLATRLTHANLVRSYGMGQCGDEPFIVMEYLDGQSLVRLLRRTRPDGLPITASLGIVSDVCAALHYLHCLTDENGAPLGVVHRDVSPENIVVTHSGQAKLLDFGIAKTARTGKSDPDMIKGKVTYMSPEQVEGEEVDARSDVFSLGVVLYESVTRRRLWGKPAVERIILRRLSAGDIPSSPRAVEPQVPECVDQICRRALAPERQDRYASAHEMRVDLLFAIASLGGRFPAPTLGEMVQDLFWLERRQLAMLTEEAMGEMGAPDKVTEALEVAEPAPTEHDVAGASGGDAVRAGGAEEPAAGQTAHAESGSKVVSAASLENARSLGDAGEEVGALQVHPLFRQRRKVLTRSVLLGAVALLALLLAYRGVLPNAEGLSSGSGPIAVAQASSGTPGDTLVSGSPAPAQAAGSLGGDPQRHLASANVGSASSGSSSPNLAGEAGGARMGGGTHSNRQAVRSLRNSAASCSVLASTAQRLANCRAISDRR